MIRDLSKKLPGAFKLDDLDQNQIIGKLAVDSSFMRACIVGRLLGKITRISPARVYYEQAVKGVVLKERWVKASSIAFIVDTEDEYEMLDLYDRRRGERIDEKVASEAADFRNHILLYNSTGKGLA